MPDNLAECSGLAYGCGQVPRKCGPRPFDQRFFALVDISPKAYTSSAHGPKYLRAIEEVAKHTRAQGIPTSAHTGSLPRNTLSLHPSLAQH